VFFFFFPRGAPPPPPPPPRRKKFVLSFFLQVWTDADSGKWRAVLGVMPRMPRDHQAHVDQLDCGTVSGCSHLDI